MLTYFIDFALALVAALMLIHGHYNITRQMAAVPLAVALVDAAFAAQIQLSLTPVLSALLIVLQMAILTVSAGVLHEDRVRAYRKRTHHSRQQEVVGARAAIRQTMPQHSRMRQAA